MPFPEMGSLSCNFVVFMCIMSKYGSSMDAKKIFLGGIILLRVFKQLNDSCFLCLSDKREQKKQYND